MRRLFLGAIAGVGVCAALSVSALPVRAEPPFYEGKIITVITSTGPGGAYDAVARLIARHMGRYIEGNPSLVVKNMPGAGNVLATNYMYTIAPKDGLFIASIHNAMPLHQALSGRGVRYDAAQFNWLGSTGPENEAVLVWHTAGVNTLAGLREKEVILGSTGEGSGISIIPKAMNQLLGTKFKMVLGYKSSEEVNLAMARGEVQARAFGYSSIVSQHPDWLRDKKVVILAQAGAKREHDLPDVPLLTELASNDQDRQLLSLFSSPPGLGRPFLAPPGVPADRLAILNKAFDATLHDATFIAEAKALKIDIDPMSGEEVAQIVRAVTQASPDVVAKAKAVMDTGNN
jgi:tripartite-type tricarboxylate transporter receptor subunit TctC